MTPILPEPLKKALAAYQAGDLAGAAGHCKNILAAKQDRNDPLYFDAVHLLAVVQFHSGRFSDALASYDAALAIKADFAPALNNRANTLKALKRFEEAIAGYNSALAMQPDSVEALNNRGNALMEMKRFEEALASYDEAIAIRPDYALALNNRGSVLNVLRRFDEAIISYDRALAIKPDFVDAAGNRGNALRELMRFEEALAAYDRALALRPRDAEMLLNRSLALAALQRFEEALASCEQSLAARPGNARALTIRGDILHALGRFEEATSSDDKALATGLDKAELFNHRIRTLIEFRRFEDALASCDAALASRPDDAEALNQRGIIQTELRRFPEALVSFAKAQKLRPDFVDAHRNEFQLHLLVGDFRRAWWKYDEQAKRDASLPPSSKYPKPQWDGLELICDRTILLHGGEAYADMIQFCRYIPLLARRGARVIVEVEWPLRELAAGISGVTQVATGDDIPTAFDFHCPFDGLPRAFATTVDTIPATVPYLRAPPQAAAEWDIRLGAKNRPRIGIVWSADPPTEYNRRGSIELAAFLRRLDVDATFLCVQRDISSADAALLKSRTEILTFGTGLSDFSEAAALLSCLDLVISADSSVAHLAGALGKPVWILLSYTPDWHWLIDREDSPWYPTARLFRQRRHDDWNEVMDRVAVELQRFVDHSGMFATSMRDLAFLRQLPPERRVT